MLTSLLVWVALEVGAEFWGRTVPLKDAEGQMKAVATETHLVVEVRVKGDKSKPLKVTAQQFRLKVNGAKLDISPDTPGMAAGFCSRLSTSPRNVPTRGNWRPATANPAFTTGRTCSP